jgi:DeoR/GlpR family transcriptional regulator of sugar metabolism
MTGPALPAVRHQQILALLAQREFVTLAEVREATGMSAATTHRDLSALAAAGALIRLRGGARRSAMPPAPSAERRILVACLTRARLAVDYRDLNATERALEQALTICRRLRRTPH